ncbi:MAG: SgcJ/EcaC family oxidoreductase [Sphingobium sp.]
MSAAQELERIVAGWNAASQPWNPEKLTALYTRDALLFGGRPHHSVSGGGIADYFASYAGVIESGHLALSDQEIRIVADDAILAQGFGTFDFTLAGGVVTQSRLRTTLLLKRTEGSWKIAAHHFSAIPDAPPLGN